ncbi:unnamed protein product, partial [Prorocentrum cordatum]
HCFTDHSFGTRWHDGCVFLRPPTMGRAHIPALLKLKPKGFRVEVAAIVGRSEEAFQKAERTLKVKEVARFASLEALLAASAADVLIVALPIASMAQAVAAAFAAGVAVLSEKPVAASLAQALELWRARGTATWCVLENWAHKPGLGAVGTALAGGAVGEPRGYSLAFSEPAPARPQLGWRAEADWEGGWCLDVGVHFVRALRRLFGEVVSVHRGQAGHVAVTAVLEHERGLRGSVSISHGCPCDADQGAAARWNGLRVEGDEADLEWRWSDGSIRIVPRSSGEEQVVKVEGDGWIAGGVRATLADALRQCALERGLLPRGGGHELHLCSAEEAIRDAAVMWAMCGASCLEASANPAGAGASPGVVVPSDLLAARGAEEDWFVLPVRGDVRMVDATGSRRYPPPAHACRPASVAEVQAAVRGARRRAQHVRAIGTDHSWGPEGEVGRSGLRMDMRLMSRFLRLAPAAGGERLAVVQAGILLGDLARLLAAQGLCLRSAPVLQEQTAGGACATGSHGSSLELGTLSDEVAGLLVVGGDGEARWLGAGGEAGGPEAPAAGPGPEDAWLRAARLSRGEVGVVCELALRTSPAYRVRRVVEWLPEAEALTEAAVRALHAGAEHLMLHWLLGAEGGAENVACVQLRRAGPQGAGGASGGAAPYTGRSWFGPELRLPREPGADGPEPAEGAWRSMEYCAPLGRLAEAAAAVRAVSAECGGRRRVEVKLLGASDATLLGPNAAPPGVGGFFCLNLWWLQLAGPAGEAERCFERGFEAAMRRLGAQPHWGKAHSADSAAHEAAARAEAAAQFGAAAAALDPDGVFCLGGAREKSRQRGLRQRAAGS